MNDLYDICVDGSRRPVHGEVVGNFGIRKPDPNDWYESEPTCFGAKCPHDMFEVTHLPTGARVGMFKDVDVARRTVAKYDEIEGIEIGTFGDGCSTVPGAFEKIAAIFNETAKAHGAAVSWL